MSLTDLPEETTIRADAVYACLLSELGVKPGDDSPEMGTILTQLLARYLASHQPSGVLSGGSISLLQIIVKGAAQMGVIFELQREFGETK